MEADHASVELKQVLGALIFAAAHPLTVAALQEVLQQVAAGEERGGVFAGVRTADIAQALAEMAAGLEAAGCGLHLAESAEGYRFESEPAGGPWVRHLLNMGRPPRLSRPALETLAIVAYRQPVTRAEIEAVRGVTVDHVIRMLMEIQLVRIIGRSELPGRPLLYGTTSAFLEHFGLKDIRELPAIEELARRDAARRRGAAEPVAPAPEGPEAGEDEEASGTAEGGPPGAAEAEL
jgi:segregation and condensation protein B